MKRLIKFSAILLTCTSLGMFSLQALAATTVVKFVNNVLVKVPMGSPQVVLNIIITPSSLPAPQVAQLAYLQSGSYTFTQGVSYSITYRRVSGKNIIGQKICAGSIAPVGGPSSITVNVGSLASTAPCPSI